MALNNMKGEIRRGGITQRQIAESMEMSENNLSLKLNERIPMTVNEAKFIRDRWLKGSSLDYLLESDGDLPSEVEKEHAALDAIQSIVNEEGLSREWHEAIAERRSEIGCKAS